MSEPRYSLAHVGLEVSDFTASRTFYERALEPLGIGVAMELGEGYAGFGIPGRPSFWIRQANGNVSGPTHLAFHATDRARVDAFHAAAPSGGGDDNRAPGPPPDQPTHLRAVVAA